MADNRNPLNKYCKIERLKSETGFRGKKFIPLQSGKFETENNIFFQDSEVFYVISAVKSCLEKSVNNQPGKNE